MSKGLELFLLVSFAAVWSSSAFISQNLPVLSKRVIKPASCPLMTLESRDRAKSLDLRKGMAAVLSCFLLFSPSLDLFSGNDGSLAFAQGATSSKSTRAAPSVDANKDPESILRLSLPLSNNKNVIRDAQVIIDSTLIILKLKTW